MKRTLIRDKTGQHTSSQKSNFKKAIDRTNVQPIRPPPAPKAMSDWRLFTNHPETFPPANLWVLGFHRGAVGPLSVRLLHPGMPPLKVPVVVNQGNERIDITHWRYMRSDDIPDGVLTANPAKLLAETNLAKSAINCTMATQDTKPLSIGGLRTEARHTILEGVEEI